MAAALTETWVSRIGVVTIGFPFVAFKLLFGLTLVQTIQGLPAALVGYSLLLLGIIDLIINLLNFAWLLFRRQALTHVCTAAIFLQNIGRYLKTPPESFTIFSAEFGAALDTMLSFCLVACAIAFNFFARFNEAEKLFWNIAVIINVLGAGFSRLLISVSPAPAQPK